MLYQNVHYSLQNLDVNQLYPLRKKITKVGQEIKAKSYKSILYQYNRIDKEMILKRILTTMKILMVIKCNI